MNLETRVPEALWDAVRTNIEKRNFTGAILDGFYFLSDLLRQKSGAEGDGSSLIGQALGGASPKIKLNKLQSESEWNIQKGVEQLLRGFYQAFRNPRSHEKTADTDEDAQVLILFIGYLVRQIDQAKAQFSRADFLKRILDPDFVPQKRYAELIIDEIPIGQLLEVFLDVYRVKDGWKPENLRHFFDVLLERLTEEEQIQVFGVISDELKIADDETTIRLIIASFDGRIWPQYHEAARLRIENRLIRSIREGRYTRSDKRCRSGALGTWTTRIFAQLSLKDDLVRAVADKMWSSSTEEQDYVFEYLFAHLASLSPEMPPRIEACLRHRLNAGNERFYEALWLGPWKEEGWTPELKAASEGFKAAEPSNEASEDDIPF